MAPTVGHADGNDDGRTGFGDGMAPQPVDYDTCMSGRAPRLTGDCDDQTVERLGS